jgi:hypothetical protein
MEPGSVVLVSCTFSNANRAKVDPGIRGQTSKSPKFVHSGPGAQVPTTDLRD